MGSSLALAQEIAAYKRANQDLYAMLFLPTEKPASLLVLNHEDETGTTGDGQNTLQERASKYNKVTGALIRAKMDKLVNSNIKQGEDPDSHFMEKTIARSELEKMGETISDRRFKDICVHRFTAEYKDIKIMMYRDPTFDIDRMQSIMRHLFLGLSFAQQRHQGRWSWRSRDCGIDLQSLRKARALRSQLLEKEGRL